MTFEMFRRLFGDAWKRWGEDQVPRLAAAFSFYLMLSLAPMLLLLVATASLVLSKDIFQQDLLKTVQSSMGEAQATLIKSIIETQSQNTGAGILATVFSVGVLIFAASGLFEQLRDSVNAIWGIMPSETGFLKMVLRKVVAVAMVIVGVVIVSGWLILDARLTYLSKNLPDIAGPFSFWQFLSLVFSLVFWSGVFAVAFRYLPKPPVAWKDVMIAAVVTSLLFSAGKYLLSFYFAISSASAAYGAAGSLVVILLWSYYSAQIFFFGVELSEAYARMYGTMKGKERKQENAVLPSGAAKAAG